MSDRYLLSGKKAFVTGGKRRIGRGIALALAEAGCDVGINDLHEDDDAGKTLRPDPRHGPRGRVFSRRHF